LHLGNVGYRSGVWWRILLTFHMLLWWRKLLLFQSFYLLSKTRYVSFSSLKDDFNVENVLICSRKNTHVFNCLEFSYCTFKKTIENTRDSYMNKKIHLMTRWGRHAAMLYYLKTYTGWAKKSPQKAHNNILAYGKPFWAKFCSIIGSLYPHMCTKFGELTLKFSELVVHFHEYPHFYSFWI